MTFPTTGVLDAFTRGDEGPPMTGWTDLIAGLKVVSNQCKGDSATDNMSGFDASTRGPDCEVYCDIVTKPADGAGACGLLLRMTTLVVSTFNGYYVEMIPDAGGDTVGVYRITGGSPAQMGADISQDFADGDGLGASMTGSTLTVYRRSAGT